MPGTSIDLNILKKLKQIMDDDFNELIEIFISDGQSQLKTLKAAIDSSAASDIRRIAHTLKGSSANLGLLTLSETCKTLEYNAAENIFDDANELFEKIKSEFEEAKLTLEEIL